MRHRLVFKAANGASMVSGPLNVKLRSFRRARAIFFDPVGFFADLDFAVPGILFERVAFTRENQQGTGNTKGMQRVL